MESMLELITEKLVEWAEQFILLLPNLIASILILIVGYWLSRWIRRTSGKFFDQISERRLLNNLFSTIIYVASLALVAFTALTILNLDRAVTSILAGIGILSLALAFAFQDIAANFISGILISVRRPVRVNDLNDPHWPVFLKARSDAIIRLKKAFDENDITIPFPIRTLDFGIKGGEKLDEMKLNLQGHESQI